MKKKKLSEKENDEEEKDESKIWLTLRKYR